MKEILALLFKKSIDLGDEEYSDHQRETNWIGNPPATSEDIKSTEERLQIDLPPDYKEMLMIANGFPTSINTVEPSFQKVSEIDYYRNYKWNYIDSWRTHKELQEVVSNLEKSIIIAGFNEEQQFLLIPPMTENETWKYWKFAHWIPGEEEYSDLQKYFKGVIEFLDDIIEKNKK